MVLKPMVIPDTDDKKPEEWIDNSMKNDSAYKGIWEAKNILNPDDKDYFAPNSFFGTMRSTSCTRNLALRV